MGYDQIVLYGESYGTQLSQTYAAAHGDRVARWSSTGRSISPWRASTSFTSRQRPSGTPPVDAGLLRRGRVLRSGSRRHPDQAYDQLLALLVEGPLTAQYPLATGGFEERTFGLGDLEVVASGQMYSEDDRMMFLRALAAQAAGVTWCPFSGSSI